MNELSRNHCLYVFQKRRLVPNIRVTFQRKKRLFITTSRAVSLFDFFCMRSVVCQNRKRVIDSFIVAWLSKINLARSVYTIYSSSFQINGLKMNNIYVLDKLYMGRANIRAWFEMYTTRIARSYLNIDLNQYLRNVQPYYSSYDLILQFWALLFFASKGFSSGRWAAYILCICITVNSLDFLGVLISLWLRCTSIYTRWWQLLLKNANTMVF